MNPRRRRINRQHRKDRKGLPEKERRRQQAALEAFMRKLEGN